MIEVCNEKTLFVSGSLGLGHIGARVTSFTISCLLLPVST